MCARDRDGGRWERLSESKAEAGRRDGDDRHGLWILAWVTVTGEGKTLCGEEGGKGFFFFQKFGWTKEVR